MREGCVIVRDTDRAQSAFLLPCRHWAVWVVFLKEILPQFQRLCRTGEHIFIEQNTSEPLMQTDGEQGVLFQMISPVRAGG